MIKSILSAAVVSLVAVSAAYALPAAPSTKLPQVETSDLVQVGKKHHGKHYGKHHYKYKYRGPRHGKWRGYHHGGRYWKYRYYRRPWNWWALGCINVGPVWYCGPF